MEAAVRMGRPSEPHTSAAGRILLVGDENASARPCGRTHEKRDTSRRWQRQ